MKAKLGAVLSKKNTKPNKNNFSRYIKICCFVFKPLDDGRCEKITREAEMFSDKRIPGSLIHSSVIKNVAFLEDAVDF